jgi:RimJ/RimL family protein N-acetyltransferase
MGCGLMNQWDRFLWDGKVVPLEQTEDIVERNERLFKESGFGIWGIREHNFAELIGFVGYWHFRTPPGLNLSSRWRLINGIVA